MKKRFPAMLLALALCMGLCAVPAFAADGDFTIEDGVLTKYNGSGGDVTIPSGVTEIGKSVFEKCSSLTSITIPDGVTTIGTMAFFGCDKLTSVTIPDSVTEIGSAAFVACASLTSVTIPDSVTTIKSSTFYSCTSLTSITIPSSVTTIGSQAFGNCTSLTSITIPSGVTTIGKEAFEKCTSLTSVTIPSNVTTIGDEVFKECTGLTICGYKGSAAQRYAKENNIPFDSLGAAPAPAVSFIDVPAGFYCEDAVNWAVEQWITNGTSDTTFEPDTTCSQVQILTFLYRAAQGEDATATAADMDAAVEWATEKGMIGEDFDREADCTRATAVSYIWQALGKEESEASEFVDVDKDADYAAAVDWAVANGVTNGTNQEAGEFSPDDTCTRGQIVTFLHRAYVEEARLK